MSNPTTAFAVANWFIQKSLDTEKPITHMKLQKLVYMAYGWYYAYYENPLFDDDICAWVHGPVIANLYTVFKDCGREPINHFAETYSDEHADGNIEEHKYSIYESRKMEGGQRQERKAVEADIENVLDIVWRDYSDLTAGQLRNLTHRPDTPWGKLFKYFNGNVHNVIIDPNDIRRYFDGLIQKYGD